MRPPHFIKPTVRIDRPTAVIFCDTETFQDKRPDGSVRHSLRLGVGEYCRTRGGEVLRHQETFSFDQTCDFWDWVEKKVKSRRKVTLVTHNLTFDLSILDAYTALGETGFELQGFYTKGQVGIFRWHKERMNLMALDNGNFFQGKLEKWGKVVGMPKIEVEWAEATEAELWDRCRRDVEIMVHLWRLWYAFLDENDCGDFKPTVASTAFGTWRHRFMPRNVWVHSDERVLSLERDAYKGGRVECFRVGELTDGPYFALDINSMYGYVMARGEYPAGFIGWKETGSVALLQKRLQRYSVVARLIVAVNEPWYPVDLDGFTCYPLGEFETTLTTAELILALRRGWVKSVGPMAWYLKRRLFTSYAEYFYNLRLRYTEAGQDGFSRIAKLLVNGLYGKFGQKGFHQKVIGTCDPSLCEVRKVYSEERKAHYRMIFLGGQVFEQWEEGEGYHSFPAIAAHVTANSRLYLTRLMRRVPAGHVFYCDTDSLMVDQEGLEALGPFLHPTNLGALKVEAQGETLLIHAPKEYVLGDKIKHKGIRLEAQEVEPGVYAQDQWPGFNGLLQSGSMVDYVVKPILKHSRRVIHSGVVLPSGWVAPLELTRSVSGEPSPSD